MNKILASVFSAAILLTFILTSIDISCFDQAFYESEYTKLGVADVIDIDFDALMNATDVLLDYTRGQRADMVVTAVIAGSEREVFDDREKAHMVDVRDLYLRAMAVRNGAAVIAIVSLVVLIIRKQREGWLFLSRYYNRISLVFLFALTALALVALADFNSFWTTFHHIFFAGNDLWLLDPDVDILIMMVPEQFFFDLVMRIVGLFAAVFVVSNGVAYFYRRQQGKAVRS